MRIQEALPALVGALTKAQASDFAAAGLHDVDTREVRVLVFPQLWGSTATGYGGIGGAAMTWAHTVVLEVRGVFLVYFARGRLAYWVVSPEAAEQGVSATQRAVTAEQFDMFAGHLQSKQLASRSDAQSWYGAVIPAPSKQAT